MTQLLNTNTKLSLFGNLTSARNTLIAAKGLLQEGFSNKYDSANAMIVDTSAISGSLNTYDLFTVGLDDPLGDNATFTKLDWLYVKNNGSAQMSIPHASALSAIPLVLGPLLGLLDQRVTINQGNFGFWDFSGSALPVTLSQGKITISGTNGQSYDIIIAGRE